MMRLRRIRAGTWCIPTHAALYELMQFRVTLPLKDAQAAAARSDAASVLRSQSIGTGSFTGFHSCRKRWIVPGVRRESRINGKGYSDPVTESVRLGSTEKWRFINDTEYAHPMHLDMAQFQVVERQGYSVVACATAPSSRWGPRVPLLPREHGWKDTAVVSPREMLTVLVRFDGFPGAMHSERRFLSTPTRA